VIGLPPDPGWLPRGPFIDYDTTMTETTDQLDPELLAILRCPLTRSKLTQEGDWLVAEQPEGAGLRYPIEDGIPILLIDQATLPEGIDSIEQFKQRHPDAIAD